MRTARLCCRIALLHTAVALRPLYPVKKALNTGKHCVAGGVHKLYYEEHGTATGAPALFLHGGPGAGCFQRHAGFFDPDHYRVLLFDQRGCGRSLPKGCLDGNETPQLIADIEELRVLLGIEAWQVVLGGSWGTTLALAYAQEELRTQRAWCMCMVHVHVACACGKRTCTRSLAHAAHMRRTCGTYAARTCGAPCMRRRTPVACARSCCARSASCASARSDGSSVRAALFDVPRGGRRAKPHSSDPPALRWATRCA